MRPSNRRRRLFGRGTPALPFRHELVYGARLVIVVGIVAVLVRFATFVLADLAHTPDEQLLYLSKWGWAAVRLLSLPFGGMVFLLYGKQR